MTVIGTIILFSIICYLLYRNAEKDLIIKRYEEYFPALLNEWRKLEKLIDRDTKSKLANFKKMLSLTWKETEFNDTHKN